MKDAFPGDETNTSPDRVLVVGVGNRLLGDEGVGPCVIDNLSRMKLPPCVNVFDCGCDLLSIVLYLDRPEKIVIVDAVRAGGKPGEIYRYDYSELATMKDETQSGHQMGTINVLRLLKSVYPVLADTEITVIGIEPKTLELGNNLSQEVEERIADVTMLVVEEICHSASFWREKVQSDSRFAPVSCRPQDYHSLQRSGPRTNHKDAGKSQSSIPHEAPVSESLLPTLDPQTLPATGTWPILTTNRSNMNRSLH